MNKDNKEIKEPQQKRRRKSRLSNKQKIIIGVVLIVYVIVLVVISFIVFYRPNVEDKNKTFIETATDKDGNIITIQHDFTAIEGTYNFLVLGHDRAALLTDVFMLVNIDNNANSITVMQIPRDTYIADNNGMTIPTNKINALFSTHYYSYIRSGESEDDAYLKALNDVTGIIEDSLCIGINYSLIMDLDGFINIVDILGGVEVDVPFDMHYSDPDQGLLINLYAGVQTLNGDQAEGFVRYRYGLTQGDLGRVNNQKIFLTALFSEVKKNLNVANAGKLAQVGGEILSNVVTDIPVADVAYFAKSVLSCDLSTINMLTIPGNMGSGYYVLNRAAALDVLNQSYNIFDKQVSDGMFDKSGIFNNPGDYAINQVYYSPADNVFDSSVYNGEDVDNNSIDIPHY